MSDKFEEWGESLVNIGNSIAKKTSDFYSRTTTTCPKCGYGNLMIRWKPVGKKLLGEEAITCRSFLTDYHEGSVQAATSGVVQEECLYIHCQTCQYSWSERTLDGGE